MGKADLLIQVKAETATCVPLAKNTDKQNDFIFYFVPSVDQFSAGLKSVQFENPTAPGYYIIR